MILTIITLLTALLIAGVAAWFSIAGLMAIFAATPLSILIMGTVLELGKLTSASWLYRNWDEAPFLLKSYLTGAVVILMLITSMGIFGFLSKAHIEQSAPMGNNMAKITRLEQRIGYEQRQVDDFGKIIAQLDVAVDTLVKYDKISGETGAIAVRKQQKAERDGLSASIAAVQANIDGYEDEKAKLSGKVRQFELEVGPLRYIADMIYEDPASKLESAVRLVIIIIIFVFDPLAVLLLIAANHSLQASSEKRKVAENLANKVNIDKDSRDIKNENIYQTTEKEPEAEMESEDTPSQSVVSEIFIPRRTTEDPGEAAPNEEGVSIEAKVLVAESASEQAEDSAAILCTDVDNQAVNKDQNEDIDGEMEYHTGIVKDGDGIVEEPIAKIRRQINNGRRFLNDTTD